jgi:hypothetical protein
VGSGGEAQSKHERVLTYGAGPSFRTVGLGAEVTFSAARPEVEAGAVWSTVIFINVVVAALVAC